MSESEIRLLQRIDRNLTRLLKNQAIKETWISGSELTQITGWDHKAKRQARLKGTIEFKKQEGVRGSRFLYLLSSIPNEFKKIA